MVTTVEREIAGKKLIIETGRMARLAHGAALVTYGETMVLVAADRGPGREGIDFFPLVVDYREKTSAAGKFPGGFMKREGRPTTKEILTMRLIDRSIRPLFPEGYAEEVQVMATVLSVDRENDPDLLAMIGAYAALAISDIPFSGPLGAVKVGMVEGKFVVNPAFELLNGGALNLTVAGSAESICMVEAGANELSEAQMIEALKLAHQTIRTVVEMITELVAKAGKPKFEFKAPAPNVKLYEAVKAKAFDRITQASFGGTKLTRSDALAAVKKNLIAEMASTVAGDGKPKGGDIAAMVEKIQSEITRAKIIKEGLRADGRGLAEVRPITIEVGVLPRVHGSALFTRGETQALVMATLGTVSDGQLVEGLMDEYRERFMLHYNFPPFSVGETKPVRGPGRREIGHGMLAQRALTPVLPDTEKFPYTIRLISDILESNGSSSMASVCGGTLALMDAGVPIQHPVAGIAMGLVVEGGKEAILTDILGSEDHLGDMDFKVTGTARGITGLQMDVKIAGVSDELLCRALEQARQGRVHILKEMLKALPAPRAEVSPHAPRMVMMKIDPARIGELIGPGGKVIRMLQEKTSTKIDVEDDGTVMISSIEGGDEKACREMVQALVGEIKVGSYFESTVVSVKDFGCFVELVPGREGLVHVSEISDAFIKDINSAVRIGDKFRVKVTGVDAQGRIKLSRKQVILEEKQQA